MDPRCDDCGRDDVGAIETVCPYAQDVHNEEVKCVLCSDCAYERAQDI